MILTSTYWLIGQRIVQHEQKGSHRAGYGEQLIKELSSDLKHRLGRGFSERNVWQMRQFYLSWPDTQTDHGRGGADQILQTVSAESKAAPEFPLSWSHYVRLLSVPDAEARVRSIIIRNSTSGVRFCVKRGAVVRYILPLVAQSLRE